MRSTICLTLSITLDDQYVKIHVPVTWTTAVLSLLTCITVYFYLIVMFVKSKLSCTCWYEKSRVPNNISVHVTFNIDSG